MCYSGYPYPYPYWSISIDGITFVCCPALVVLTSSLTIPWTPKMTIWSWSCLLSPISIMVLIAFPYYCSIYLTSSTSPRIDVIRESIFSYASCCCYSKWVLMFLSLRASSVIVLIFCPFLWLWSCWATATSALFLSQTPLHHVQLRQCHDPQHYY